MIEFVSESVTPRQASFDTVAMGRGEPGLPTGFRWRGAWFEVLERLEQWKQSGPEIGRLEGELYLRRHNYRLRMSDNSIWTVYFVRHRPTSGSPKRRWFLYTIEREEEG